MKTLVTRTWVVGVGLVWLLSGLPMAASAQPSGVATALAAPSVGTIPWFKVALTNTTPKDIIGKLGALMHIEGVKRIYVMQADKNIFVQATPDGLGRLQATLASPDVQATPKTQAAPLAAKTTH